MSKEQTKTVTIRIPEPLYFRLTEGGKKPISSAIVEMYENLHEFETSAKEDLKGVFSVKEWEFLEEFCFGRWGDELATKYGFWGLIHTKFADGLAELYNVDCYEIGEVVMNLTESQYKAIEIILDEYINCFVEEEKEDFAQKKEHWFEYYAKK